MGEVRALATDAVIPREADAETQVLLLKRNREPYEGQ